MQLRGNACNIPQWTFQLVSTALADFSQRADFSHKKKEQRVANQCALIENDHLQTSVSPFWARTWLFFQLAISLSSHRLGFASFGLCYIGDPHHQVDGWPCSRNSSGWNSGFIHQLITLVARSEPRFRSCYSAAERRPSMTRR